MKVALVAPGYGSQFIGMGKELYDNSRLVQEYFEQASTCLDINFVKLCFAESEVELSQLTAAYPALFLLQSASAALCKESGINFELVAGHDIGIFCALFAAGGINLPDGLYLLSKWAQLFSFFIHAEEIHGRGIRGITERKLKLAMNKLTDNRRDLAIGIYEEAEQFSLFGLDSLLDKLEKQLRQEHVIVENISLDAGVFTTAVEQISRSFAMYLEKVDCKDLSIPLLSGATKEETTLSAVQVKKFLQHYFAKPLYWQKVLVSCERADSIIIPMRGTILKAQLESYYPHKPIFMLNNLSDLEKIVTFIEQHKLPTSSGEK
jgi:[acyl-carrier-protein] S-malonyltransferase